MWPQLFTGASVPALGLVHALLRSLEWCVWWKTQLTKSGWAASWKKTCKMYITKKKMNAWILLRAPANYWKGKRNSNDPRKQAKEMHRKFTGNVLQVASKHRQMLRISEIRAACKDHILWLDDHPPHPPRARHILFSETKWGTEDENMSTNNEKLHSVKLWVPLS